MDDRLEKALKFANKAKTLNDATEIAKINFENECTFAFNGAIFKINPEMINYVYNISQTRKRTVIMDYKHLPVMIEDVSDFKDKITNIYHEASNKYLVEILKIKSKRTVEDLI